jgi:type IV fimbrial biogenesis protein FimT
MDSLKRNGFTLIELMVGVGVLAIALVAGVPSMAEFIKNSRLAAQTNDILASFHLARTEAIKRNSRVTVCRSTNGSACSTAAGSGWHTGWLVFADTANFGTLDPGEIVFDAHGAAANNVVIVPLTGDTITNFVSYTARGVVRDAAGVAQSGVLRVCDERGIDHARGLVVNATGRVEFTHDMNQLAPGGGTCP